jgi:hypothetical protein
MGSSLFGSACEVKQFVGGKFRQPRRGGWRPQRQKGEAPDSWGDEPGAGGLRHGAEEL